MSDEADVTKFLLTGHENAVVGDGDDVGVEPDAYRVWVPLTITARPELVFLTGTTPPRTLRLRPVHARIENGVLRLIGGSASINEEQTITVTGNPFTLTWNGSGPTSNLAQTTATKAQVLAALEALSNITPGDVQVVGDNGGPFTVFFQGAYAATNVPAMTATNATIGTTDQGTENAGVRLVAKTSVLNLGDTPLLYDVRYGQGTINGENVDFKDQDFTFAAPSTDVTLDLTTVTRV